MSEAVLTSASGDAYTAAVSRNSLFPEFHAQCIIQPATFEDIPAGARVCCRTNPASRSSRQMWWYSFVDVGEFQWRCRDRPFQNQ